MTSAIVVMTSMNPAMAAPDGNSAKFYAENVAEILLNGMSLPG
jgi:hypothetical protein